MGRLLVGVSTCTLEIYMIQRWIIEKLEWIVFPTNLLLILGSVLFAGYLIHLVPTILVDRIEGVMKKNVGGI